jgi:DNA polymerase-1
VTDHEYSTHGGKYHIISSIAQLDSLIVRLNDEKEFSIDTETTGQQPLTCNLVGISLSLKEGEAYYIPVGHTNSGAIRQLTLETVREKLGPVIGSISAAKVTQNGKFDITVLQMAGISLRNVTFDTMIAAYLLGDKQIGLKAMSFNRLGVEMAPITDLIGKGAKQLTMDQVDIEKASDYACADADMTLRLRNCSNRNCKRRI